MADPGSSMRNALHTVAIHADTVWWPVSNDSYRIANLNLFNNVLRIQGSSENPNDRHAVSSRYPRKEEPVEDPEDWLKGHCWRTREMSGSNAPRGLLSEGDLWYETEEKKQYLRIWRDTFEKIWGDIKPDTCRWRRHVPYGVHENLTDFYPSVLHARSPHTMPTYPSINEQAFQSELFPYRQHDLNHQQQNQNQWHLVNAPHRPPQTGVYQSNQDPYDDWRKRQVNMAGLLLLQRPIAERNQRVEMQQSYQSQVLLGSDFPELPNRERRGGEISELRYLVQTMDQERAEELSRSDEEVALGGSYGPTEQQAQAEAQEMLLQNAQEGRRLYRDVVAAKQEDNSYTNMEDKFEELEREALEQYNDSQNDIEVSPELDICLEVEEKFLDLERQAMEQYEDQEELDEEPIGEREQYQIVGGTYFPDGLWVRSPEREMHYHELLQPQDETPCSSVAVQERPVEPFSNPPELHHSKTPQYETSKTTKLDPSESNPKAQEIHQAISRVSPLGSSKGFEKRRRARNTRTFHPPTSLQERSKKYEDISKTTYFKRKESSPETGAVRMKKCPPVTVVDKEVRALANRLKATALNYLKGVDMKMLTEKNSKVALRELLYEKQQNETIRKKVKVVDIQDTDMLRMYAKEIAGLARHQMKFIMKRIRKEVVEMPSRRTIFVAQPNTAEKRKVRYFINKCLELMNKAESLKKMPKKPLESSKREISDTLTMIHKTMEVVYKLRDMCRQTYEEMETLMSCRITMVELILGQSFLEDKSEYIRRKVQEEKLSLLLYCLFPRRQSILFDRSWWLLEDRPDSICVSPTQQRINDTLLINHHPEQFEAIGVKRVRLMNTMVVERPRRKDLWDAGSWQKVLIVGSHRRSVNVVAAGPVPVPELLGLGTWISLWNSEYLPEERRGKSDLEQRRKQPMLTGERTCGTWMHQPKQQEKAVTKNDGGCSIM